MSNVKIYTAVSEDLSPFTLDEGFYTGMVRYSDYAALEAKCASLAAENASLNKFIDDDCYVYGPHDVEPVDAAVEKPQTPAADAFLAEVRAQGVEMFAEHLSGMNISVSETSVREFATKLRQECSHEQISES